MNRRYSKHTEILKEYISSAKGPFHLDCIFNVPSKDPMMLSSAEEEGLLVKCVIMSI